ncbi:hypothetical protein LDENG_00170640 [Lucifuga dentata]|nr:hypothetical protein LDENG_00170640 [Lucifuga dentata]
MPKKDDSKSAAKKGKAEESKKGGKDDKKGEKKAEEPPAKGKGKDDGKKGKSKKPVSESEEGSEEEEEEMKSEEEEEDEEKEETPKKSKGKAQKGASKAAKSKPSKHSSSSEEEDKRPQLKKGMNAVNLKKMSNVQLKGASKAMMGFAAEGQKKSIATEGQKRSIPTPALKVDQFKGASKAMMGFAAEGQKRSVPTPALKVDQFKGASKAMTGLTGKISPFGMPKPQQPQKAKPKRNLKSTSRLFFRISKKKKPASSGSKPLLGASKLLSGLGAKSTDKSPGLSGGLGKLNLFNKKDDKPKESPASKLNLSLFGDKGKAATQGLGGKFKGLFAKKKTGPKFKSKSSLVAKIAAATNWLTGKFLTSYGHGRRGARAGRRGQKQLSFANRGTRGRQRGYYSEGYEYEDDDYEYDEDYHDQWRPRGYLRQPMAYDPYDPDDPYDPYDPYGEEMDYYDDDDDDEWEDEYGYYDDYGNFYDDDEFYYDDEMDYYGYSYDYYGDEYDDFYDDEEMDYYYGEDGMLYAMEPDPYDYYGNTMDGFYDPYEADLYGDYADYQMGYNYEMSDPYDMMGAYNAFGPYNDPMLEYADPAAIYNPYQQPFHMDAGLDPAEITQQQLSYPVVDPFSSGQFRFPRPQVRLFGKERLEVETLPPPLLSRPSSPVFATASPIIALNDLDMMSDIQYEQPLPTYPAQPQQTSSQSPNFPLAYLGEDSPNGPQWFRGGAGGRSHVPMGAVKPSPANPYLHRHSRHGPPVTQHVAPFRSSIHSGPGPTPGQMGAAAGPPMLARTGSRPTGLRESNRLSSPQGGFHRPVGRGQPLVHMPRNQSSLPSRQSFRGPPPVPPSSPQSFVKHSGPLSPQSSVRRLQSLPPSPLLQRHSSLLSRSASPMRHLSYPPSPLPNRAMSSQMSMGPFQPPIPPPSFPPGTIPPSQGIAQYDYAMMEPGPSPILANALQNPQIVGVPFPPSHLQPTASPLQRPSSPLPQPDIYPQNPPSPVPSSPLLGRALQNPHLQNINITSPLQRSPSPIPGGQLGISAEGQVNQYISPLSSPVLSSALYQNSHLRSASYSSPLQRNANLYTTVLSPHEAADPLFPSVPSSPQLSSSMITPQLQNASFASPFQQPLSPLSPAAPMPPSTPQQQVRGASPLLHDNLRTSQIQGSMFRLPDGTLTMSQAPAVPGVPIDGGGGVTGDGRLSPSMLSNALQNPSLAILTANLRNASYRLPDGSILSLPGEEKQNAAESSPMLSGALLKGNLSKAKFQLPGASSFFSQKQAQAPPSGPLLSGAMLNTNVRGASYKLSSTSLFKHPGSAGASESHSLDLSNALRNTSVRSATYHLPDGTLMVRPRSTSATRTLDLSNALSKNPHLRQAKYRLPDGNIMARLGAPSTPEPRSLNLSNALQNSHLRGASYRLPSSYVIGAPNVQGSGPGQHWAHGPGVDGLRLQGVDLWDGERVLPHGTVQNLNKWSMYGDGELLDPQALMGQGNEGLGPGQWNLSREGEPQGHWYDKTYIGSILVSVNPYKMYNIYGTDTVLQYKGHTLGENPP